MFDDLLKQNNELQKLYPEYNNPESNQNDKYMQIVLNSMSVNKGGS
jgi:hypothetical protein